VFTLYLNKTPPGLRPGIVINFAAAVACIVLLRALLRARRGRPPMAWDLARGIGVYQIGAGALGVFNAFYRTDGLVYLLFSVLMIASGVALVRRARWSDAFGIAVNALQVPAFSFNGFTYLLRSGVSLVAALSFGAQAGIQLRLDLGSVLGDPLAPGVENFVGLNVVALALAIVLTGDVPLRDQNDAGLVLVRRPRARHGSRGGGEHPVNGVEESREGHAADPAAQELSPRRTTALTGGPAASDRRAPRRPPRPARRRGD
jgi:hypothetical protein